MEKRNERGLSIRRTVGYIPTACENCGTGYVPEYEWSIYTDREKAKYGPQFWFLCEKCAKEHDPELYDIWLQIRNIPSLRVEKAKQKWEENERFLAATEARVTSKEWPF